MIDPKKQKLIIVTHCWPTEETSSGQFIKDVVDFFNVDYEVIGGSGFTRKLFGLYAYCLKTWWQIFRSRGRLFVWWGYPSGVLAMLSGKRYVLVMSGLDVFALKRSKLLQWLLRPVFNRADRILFPGKPLYNGFLSFGSRYKSKMEMIYLPVRPEFFKALNSAFERMS